MAEWSELEPYSRLVNTSSMEPRAYQVNIIRSVLSGKNSLVVLPTGLGKTLIAVFAIAKALYDGKKAVILAPTKPLSQQHHDSLVRLLKADGSDILLLTGTIGAQKRKKIEEDARVIAATPQTIANDLSAARLSMEGVGVVIFDECHRGVGRYAYTYIANECKLRGVQVVGLTASPGSNRKRIDELLETFGIENIEIRSTMDGDVAPYVMGKSTNSIYVDTGPSINAILARIKPVIDEHLKKLHSMGLSRFTEFEHMPKGRLLEIGTNIDRLQAQNYKYGALFNYVYVLDLTHAYDLLATEGVYPFISYMESLQHKEHKSRSVDSLLKNPDISEAMSMARKAYEAGVEHPKMAAILEMMHTSLRGKSAIIFVQYRSTIKRLTEILNAHGVAAVAFVGKTGGITQAQQEQTLLDFRGGKHQVLVATSIGEEGLDIPSVDAVVFYEPIPSEIRNIQRKGRAGRMKFGEVFILVAKGTRDEAYLMISKVRERRMAELVYSIKSRLEKGTYRFAGKEKAGQKRLG